MMIEKINKVKKSIKNLQYVLIFYGAVFIISISAIINNNVINNEYKLENKILKDSIDRMHLSDSIYQYLLSFNNLKHKDIVFNQFKIESSNFTSSLFKKNNNLSGMKMPYQRPTTAICDSGGYAYYKNWEMSIIDYALYQTYQIRNSDTSRANYLKILKRYAKDPNYINIIK